jgi:hypothetical protein
VSLSSRDANSKAAASEASNIFQSHYPEFLVRISFHSRSPHNLIIFFMSSTRNFLLMFRLCSPGSIGHSSLSFRPKHLPKCLLSAQANQAPGRLFFLTWTWSKFRPGMVGRLKRFNYNATQFRFVSIPLIVQ